MWRKRYKHLLDSIFEECASHEITVGPDEAMDWMEELLERLVSDSRQDKPEEDASGPVAVLRFNFAAYRREAHHYAVDRFYKTYFPRKRGGEPLSISYLDRILELSRKGMNPARIAALMKQRQNTIAKQLAVAEKRWPEAWREAVARIERIKQRSPYLVAPNPTSAQQSKRQKLKVRAGK
jgi:hypothetical protein